MKKIITVLVLTVFVLGFVGTVLATKSEASAKQCDERLGYCTIEFVPGGEIVCCYDWVWDHGSCVLVDLGCEFHPD